MNNETTTEQDPKPKDKIKDKWDKLEILLHPIGGLFTGLAIAAVGYFGSLALDSRQTNEINMRLYSELMNQREQAENKLRSDMFKQIFDSFLAKSDPDKDKPDKGTVSLTSEEKYHFDMDTKLDISSDIDEAINLSRIQLNNIKNDLLRLELLTRNFHESIDIKPIFEEILFKILRVKWAMRSLTCASILEKAPIPKDAVSKKFKNDCNDFATKDRYEDAINNFKRDINKRDKNSVVSYFNAALKLNERTTENIKYLRDIAYRISGKQIENLANDTNFIKLSIPKKDVCNIYNPPNAPKDTEAVRLAGLQKVSTYGTSDSSGSTENICMGIPGYEKVIMLSMHTSDREYQRIFRIKVEYAFTKWSQVYVTVKATRPNEAIECPSKKDNIVSSDRKPDNDRNIHNSCASFWVSSFDFPLVDNTYLSEDERYGVAIDSIDKDTINLVLVYFPASYAGLKEKSFYHKKVLNHLAHWSIIKGDEQ